MKVPGFDRAIVPEGKLTRYLLNPDHPDGGTKARFFVQVGFDEGTLSTALLRHIREYGITEIEMTFFGIKYGIDGFMESPSGYRFHLRSVWIILNGETIPKLVTAFPSKK